MVYTLKFQDRDVPVPGFGAMGFSQSYGPAVESESFDTLSKAVELGCVFWDTAAVYGGGHNETLLGNWVKQNPGSRDRIFIGSKCGILPNRRVLNSKEHIEEYLAKSTERLGFAPDLYYLHRIEPGRDLKESIGTLHRLREEGKCKFIGLSECSVDTLRKAHAVAPISCIQIEYSPWCTDHEQSGLIDAAKELGVAVIAFSPLGRGILTGTFTSRDDFPAGDFRLTIPQYAPENFDKNMRIVKEFQKLAEKKGCTSSQLALAWVMAHGAIPIPGTKSVGRLVENWESRNVDLNEAELAEIRKLVEEAKPEGARYNAEGLKMLGH